MLIDWLKQYFEVVWQWSKNKEYAVLAPMNTMADNVGGSTMHSFGRIAFKDRRGAVIFADKGSKDSHKAFGTDEWHELRFLLFDEVEAAGVSLFGTLEENVRTRLPLPSVHNEYITQQLEKNKGLEKQVHKQRCRKIAFAGVNVICF